ncbi:putative vomeronasal receptor-like protein 4 [Lepus europaeus]|uniref:putative vomeronasal receptor-like protein 4 n=1 Tax=Lepus europaeus TaxID=9983 RepID=UPI002B4777F0|nr:putative vomeronasal receptor-like protein 4 [Lepus europaeus]
MLLKNALLLLFHIFTFCQDHRPKPSSLTVCHLALVHTAMLLTVVLLASPDLFESLHFQNDFKCKALYYIGRVMQGLSICTTGVLSTIQAITLSPSTSWMAKFKHKLMNTVTRAYVFTWTLTLASSGNLLFYIVPFSNLNQTNLMFLNKYCSLSPMSSLIRYLFYALTTSRDVSFVGVMLLSSVYLVNLLFRHQRRAQHLHSASLSPRPSPERRAAQAVLLLVGFFVVMSWMDFLITTFPILLSAYGPDVLSVRILVSNVYATVSPLVLLSSDGRVSRVLRNVQQVFTSI